MFLIISYGASVAEWGVVEQQDAPDYTLWHGEQPVGGEVTLSGIIIAIWHKLMYTGHRYGMAGKI